MPANQPLPGHTAEATFIGGVMALLYKHHGEWGWITDDKQRGAYPFRSRVDARNDATLSILKNCSY